MIEYPVLADLIPEGESGRVKIEHMHIAKKDSEFTALRAAVNPGRDEYIPEGTYVRLFVNGDTMMTDTPMEKNSNRSVIIFAHGNVLIAGLGIGMILHPICAKEKVTSVTVIEKSADVIKLVGPSVPKKVTVIQGDIFEWKPPKGTLYDTIYFDIWAGICEDNLKQMATLNRRFARCKAEGAYVDSWQRSKLLSMRSNRQRRGMW
jgi:hypothetical protein